MTVTDRHLRRINRDALRHGPAVLLSSGERLRLNAPDGRLLTPEVIARSLARLPRWLGHTTQPMTVAHHVLIVSDLADPEDALAGLLHDAVECCVADVPTPVKYAVGAGPFEELEDRVSRAIAAAYGVEYPWPASVLAADDVALAWEMRDLLPASSDYTFRVGIPEPPAEVLVPMTPARAEREWLKRFRVLTR